MRLERPNHQPLDRNKPSFRLGLLQSGVQFAASKQILEVRESSVPGTCVIGLQWGDEAKGKLVDILTEKHDVVVRYQGGQMLVTRWSRVAKHGSSR